MTIDKPYFVTPTWKVLLHDLGAEPVSVLRRAGLPEDLFARDKAALSAAEFFQFWHSIAEEVSDPELPLRIGSAISFESFDPVVFAAFCSKDLNTALSRIAEYKRLICEMALRVDVSAQETTLDILWLDETAIPPLSLILSKLVYFTQLARLATRRRIVPLRVECPALPTPRGLYTEYFGVALTKGDRPILHFSPADAARPFLMANEAVWQFFAPSLKKRLADLTEIATTEERVHGALLELLPGGNASLDAVAKKLGLSPRTLRRRLKDEGRNFQAILDHTREALAKHYLKTSAMTGAEISFLLGYKDPNSFFRAFNAWTGTTPERARRDLVGVH